MTEWFRSDAAPPHAAVDTQRVPGSLRSAAETMKAPGVAEHAMTVYGCSLRDAHANDG